MARSPRRSRPRCLGPPPGGAPGAMGGPRRPPGELRVCYLRGCGDIAERQVGESIVFRKTDFAAPYRFLQPSEVFLR